MATSVFRRHDRAVKSSTPADSAELAPLTTQAAAPAPMESSEARSTISSMASTGAILAALAGIALWGHTTDWTFPKFSSLWGGRATAEEAWCQEHNVLETQCIECNVALAPPRHGYGWCGEHGVSMCPLHHPEVAELKTTPVVPAARFARAERALSLLPRTENNSRCKLYQRRIQLASIHATDKAGIDIAVVKERPIVEAIVANGELTYDETRSAHLASRVAGTVWRVEKQVGDAVQEEDVLALIDAAEVGRAKSDFLQAISQAHLRQTTVDRLAPLASSGSVPERQFREAEAALQEAQIRLLTAQQMLVNLGLPADATDFAKLSTQEIATRIQFLGLPSTITASLDAASTTSNLFPLRASLAGLVVARHVVPGEVVNTGVQLFGVADVDRMWLTLDVRQEDAKYVAIGQAVLFRPSDGHQDEEFQGSVDWISTAADDRTRTVKVRVVLPNISSCLRANTYGTGRIVLRQEASTIVVPSEAVHWDGCCNVVFVRDRNYLQADSPKYFHVRQVRWVSRKGIKPKSWSVCSRAKSLPARTAWYWKPNCSAATWARAAGAVPIEWRSVLPWVPLRGPADFVG